MTAPIASGWSGCRVGLAPTGKRRLVTAHAKTRSLQRLGSCSASTPESRHRSATLPIGDVIVCYGGAKLTDKHLAATVHCVDDGIIGWLKRRERRRRDNGNEG
jgi:hypothetical protein